MATESHIGVVEEALAYKFHSKSLLRLALTAAGAEEEHHDGNKHLAAVGQGTIRLSIADIAFDKYASSEITHIVQSTVDSKAQLSAAAARTGIEGCIKLCRASGPASPYVVSQALRAIIGAVWRDCGSHVAVNRIIARLNPCLETCWAMPTAADVRTHLTGEMQPPAPVVHVAPHPSYESLPLESPSAQGSIDELLDLSSDEARAMHDTLYSYETLNDALVPHEVIPCRLSIPAPALRQSDGNTPPSDNPSSDLSVTERQRRGDNTNRQDSVVQGTHSRNKGRRRIEHRPPKNPDAIPLKESTNELQGLQKRELDTLGKLSNGLCSAPCVVALQQVLVALRSQEDPRLQPPVVPLSPEQRLMVIDKFEGHIASFTILKRCHVVKLWEEYCAEAFQAQDHGLVFLNTSSPSKNRRPGNPLHINKSLATNALMSRLYPDLSQESTDCNRKYERAKRFIKLGQRLSILKQRFGLGILGLLQNDSSIPGTQTHSEVSDYMLVLPSDTAFGRIVSFLDRYQGGIIRKFTAATGPIIGCIWDGTLPSARPFALERTPVDRIVQLPRGSDELLSLINAL